MCEREKRASALIKRISAFGITHAAQTIVTVKPGKKKKKKAYPWITPVVYTPAALGMMTQEPLILHLLIFCCDWQMKGSAWTGSCSIPFTNSRAWRLGCCRRATRGQSHGFSRHVRPDCFSFRRNPSIQSPFALWILYRELLQAKQIKHHLPGCSTTQQQVSRSNHRCHGKQSLFSLFWTGGTLIA